jgi:hypothetical protein
MHTKDLASLLQLLDLSGQSGRLIIQPPGTTEGEGEWVAILRLAEGTVVSCQIQRSVDGVTLSHGQVAMQWLMGLGQLTWTLEEEPVRPLSPQSSETGWQQNRIGQRSQPLPSQPDWQQNTGTQRSQSLSSQNNRWPQNEQIPQQNGGYYIPQRTAGGAMPINGQWSREQRMVFALIDGRRSLIEIAQLLRRSPQVVEQIMYELRVAGWIY